MSTAPGTALKLAAVLGLLVLAGYLLVRAWRQDRGGSEKAFFYDLSEKRLFTGPRTAVPPIRGINDAEEDAVRAVVISTNGNAADKRTWQIAYLERCSPQLKRQMEAAQQSGVPPPMGRTAAQDHRFVRRLTDSEWYPLSSDDGERVVSSWLTAGPGGGPAVVCTP